MIIITNISNKPVGLVGGQVCLPNEKIEIKDKDGLCDVFDEDGFRTGERQVLPGLKAMERRKFITIEVVEEEKPKKAKKEQPEVVEQEKAPAEEAPVEEAPTEKKTTRKRTTKKTAE